MKTKFNFIQKRELFIGLFLLITGLSFGQIVTIPDAIFKARLLQSRPFNTIAQDLNGEWFRIDSNNDGEIGIDEALQVSFINVYYSQISSLEGIINFSNLQELDCSFNDLITLDVQGLSNLQVLWCDGNALTTLDVQGLSNLQKLDCSNNALTTLDVQGLSNLQEVSCNYNDLTFLDMQGLSNLQEVSCNNNALTFLDMQGLSNLQRLDCRHNALTTLNVQGLSNLKELWCGNNILSTLDLQGLSNLQRLFCQENDLITLDVQGLSNLQNLRCENNNLTTLEVQGLSNLQQLLCWVNAFTTLDVRGLYNLKSLRCNDNNLTTLYIKNTSIGDDGLWIHNNPNLSYICADNDKVTSVQTMVDDLGYNCIVDSLCTFTSTQEIDNNLAIGISPNPVTDILSFNTHINIHKVEIFDARGRSIQSQYITGNQINVAHFAKGIYFIKAFTAEGLFNKKMIKD